MMKLVLLANVAVLAFLTCMAAVTSVVAADSLAILPGEFTLSGSNARQQLLVEHVQSNEFVGQVRAGVTFTSSNERVVKIENSVAIPVGNGVAQITASDGKQSTRANVTVDSFGEAYDWSFRNHVLPEDVQSLFPHVAGHRLHLAGDGRPVPGATLTRLLHAVGLP